MLSLFSLIEYVKVKQTKKQLLSLIKEAKRVATSNSESTLLFKTDDKIVKKMCAELNEIVSQNNKNKIEYDAARNSVSSTLSNISHDIKTPLATALGYIEILEQTSSVSSYSTKIKNKIIEVNQIVSQFSILAKLDSNDMLFSIEPININELCRQILFSFSPTFISNNFEVQVSIPENGTIIYTDRYALKSILENLINNVLVHGKDGNFFSLTLQREHSNVIISIGDKGKGIAKKNICNIFDRTFMEDSSRNTKNQGSGLGLAIVTEYLTRLNGQIEVTSKPYVETLFKVTIPIS
ncbi:hypothetical protein RV11_GL003162 [Enterococcus phoeniculicola]|nr:hypothetical protein RV11_GL003162 [Enterococcus phoeniculicola]